MAEPKHMVLTKEDREFLMQLHDFIYLHKDFIANHIYTSYTGKFSIYKRLDKLKKNGYIRVYPSMQIRETETKVSNVYTLTKFGLDTVQQMRGIVHWRSHWSGPVAARWYMHQLLIAETVMAYKNASWVNGMQVKEWVSEERAFYEFPTINAATKAKTAIRPDGIIVLGMEGSNKNLGVMIEMERSYGTKENTIRKIEQFNDFFAREDELMEGYKRSVAFDPDIAGWKILFIGGTDAKANKILRDLAGESSEVPVLVASKEAIENQPYGAVYRDIRDPEKYVTL